jgi:hypothetical protein
MKSHTVPRKLLDQFAFDDPKTKSRRLYRYEKSRPVRNDASPKTATRWDGHFAHPTNLAKEAELEDRLNREFENPVNDFIEMIGYRTFVLTPKHIRLLAGYIKMLFNRTRARQRASVQSVRVKNEAFMAVAKDEERLAQITAKFTMDAIKLGYGVDYVLTKQDVLDVMQARITKNPTAEETQLDYLHAIETMTAFPDEVMVNGHWGIIRTEPDNPFVISDAPVVTFERSENNQLYFGIGFARPNVEAFLPVSPTTCLHVLPNVVRTRDVRLPAAEEVNMAQAAFATHHCFGNVNSDRVNAVLQSHFGIVQMGVTGFNTNHIDMAKLCFDILMGRRPQAA